MRPSMQTICAARVALARQMQTDRDPRLRIAFDELRQCLVEDEARESDSTRELIAASRYVLKQAG